MKKQICLLLIMALLIGAFSGFSDVAPASGKADAASTVTGKAMKITKKTKATTEEMNSGYNTFAMRTLKEAIAGEEEGTNVMISPASLMFALDMAAMGAKGKTYSQMASLFMKGATKRDLLNYAKYYRSTLEKSGLMKIANSIWINENNLNNNNVRINEGYLNLLRKAFKAAAASRKFDDTVKDEVNKWISDNTNGMIKKVIEKLTDDNVMLIINAMAFEGKWKDEYKESDIDENGVFTNSDGKEEKAKMLYSEENRYFETENEKGFLKYYEGDKYAFMAILPNDAKLSMKDYVKGLSDDAIEKFYNSLYRTDVDTRTPAFSFDYQILMNDMLKKLGMKKAFTQKADFFQMLDPKTLNPDLALFISSVIQKTHIELDEKGTKAAAVTVIEMNCTTTAYEPEKVKKSVILNRPFMFAIMDTETGTPVFTGIVNTVAE